MQVLLNLKQNEEDISSPNMLNIMNGLLSFQVLFMLTVYTAIMVPFEIVYELAQEDACLCWHH